MKFNDSFFDKVFMVSQSDVDSAIDMYSRIREIMERREKLKAKWKNLLAEVEEYRDNYYNIVKGTKK